MGPQVGAPLESKLCLDIDAYTKGVSMWPGARLIRAYLSPVEYAPGASSYSVASNIHRPPHDGSAGDFAESLHDVGLSFQAA